jgi:hypothetical protein
MTWYLTKLNLILLYRSFSGRLTGFDSGAYCIRRSNPCLRMVAESGRLWSWRCLRSLDGTLGIVLMFSLFPLIAMLARWDEPYCMCCFFISLGCASVSLVALVSIFTISCVSSSDDRGWNFVPLSKKDESAHLQWGICHGCVVHQACRLLVVFRSSHSVLIWYWFG